MNNKAFQEKLWRLNHIARDFGIKHKANHQEFEPNYYYFEHNSLTGEHYWWMSFTRLELEYLQLARIVRWFIRAQSVALASEKEEKLSNIDLGDESYNEWASSKLGLGIGDIPQPFDMGTDN